MKRGLLWAGGGVAVVAGLVVAGAVLVLETTGGSRWALAQVPGLAVDNFRGHLGGHWSADEVRWEQGGTRLLLKTPLLEWSPSCLLHLTLCIERLEVEQISLTLPPSAPSENSGPLQLPDLKLPIKLQVGEIYLGSLSIDGSEQVQKLKLAAQWTADGLRIDSLHAQRDDLALDLSGTIAPGGRWPLKATAQLQLPKVGEQPWQLALDIDGNLLDSLQLHGQSSGYLPATVSGELQPLADNLPAQLHIVSAAFKAAPSLPDTLQLNQLDLSAKGDLKSGYQIVGKAQLPAEGEAMNLALTGVADAKGAKVQGLQLGANDNQRVKLDGQLSWQGGLSADARLDWLDFPWHHLYPDVAEPQVSVHRFSTEVAYRNGKYMGNFSGDFNGPAGAFSLASPFSGDLGAVFLPQLNLAAGKGTASGSLKLYFADAVRWDAALDLSNLDPAFWVAELPGNLAGPLRSKGELAGGKLQLDADLDLKGRLRGQPAVLQAKAQGADQRWTLANLDIRLGDNHINGSGSLDQRLAGRIDLDLPRLGQLWPQLQGQLKGRIDAAGTLQAPQGELALKGQGLGLGDNRLQAIDLAATLSKAQQGTLALTASGIRAGETALGTLTAKAAGDLRKQQLQLDLKGPQLVLATALDGTLDKGNWRGRLASADIQAGGQDWRLAGPAKLERLANGTLNLGAHCFQSGGASLCGEDQRLMPEPKLRYHLKQFPLQSLAQWLPKDFAWQGLLNADLQLDLPASGPKGQVLVDASGGTLRLKDKDQWLDFPYQVLRLSSTLGPRRIDTQLQFQGERLGQLQVNARIDPLARNKPLSGDFRLQGLDIGIARPFAPMVEKLAGRLDGSGQLAGTLVAPQVNGTVKLSGGEIAGAQLPVSFTDLQVQAQIAGESLHLQGDWKSGKAGQGSLGGQLQWGQALAADISLKGTRLPVTVEPYAELEAAPDLHIVLADDKLAVTGKVLIPTGAITVRELPPSTVKVSEDTVIIGHQAPPAAAPMAMAMDINVEVGQDKLTFTGFGLSANLAGHLHIGDNLDTRGELNLNDGRYRAYGQRLTIRRARLLFAGPIAQPYLDIEAIRQTDDVIAGIRLSGSAEQPTTEVFSEPTMSQEQALSYLVLGRPLSTTGEDNNMLAQAALGLGLAGSSKVTDTLAKDLGIQDFQLDTQGSGTTTSVVASGNLSEKLTLRYGVGVFEPANTIALRYKLSKKVYVEVASGVASSLDIFYKRDF
ncbi:translocation/assembly module TamB domain-containing protein [Pseudomonas sp. App30]|uniref:translocation/assembly module TamB domain-containing protein n=1 Tax=Pseudomonas sp. App30 TaxID=3068990 RepID=UPI003A7F9CCB